MQEEAYRNWLTAQGREASTLSTSCSMVRRLESAYGDLAEQFLCDGFEAILAELAYSKIDQRNGEANPSKLLIDGDIYNGLSSARTHLNYYRRFLEDQETTTQRPTPPPAQSELNALPDTDPPEAILSLERDLNAALRQNIAQLEAGLRVVDHGKERAVASGRIDILAEDANEQFVVIELKAVRAPRDAVAQVLAYMGDIQSEQGDKPVRGMLIAPDFDPRALAAASMVPSLELKRFSFQFTFENAGRRGEK
jgi:hypothetical protein